MRSTSTYIDPTWPFQANISDKDCSKNNEISTELRHKTSHNFIGPKILVNMAKPANHSGKQ